MGVLTNKNNTMKIIVENELTGERYPVAEFNAMGDAMICLGALSDKAPKHMTYLLSTSLQIY